MTERDKSLKPASSKQEIDAFIKRAGELTKTVGQRAGKGRLVFALDATASRQPTWDVASQIQGQMFEAVAAIGGLEIQLCFYRGYNESRASRWCSSASELHRAMMAVRCAGGLTQIERVLRHTLAENQQKKVNALVFVGDCMEENPDLLCNLAGQLGIHRTPVFLFQDGVDPDAERTFKEIARLSGGAHCRFDFGSAQQLQDLLTAVAVYAAGGAQALESFGQERPSIKHMVKQITSQS